MTIVFAKAIFYFCNNNGHALNLMWHKFWLVSTNVFYTFDIEHSYDAITKTQQMYSKTAVENDIVVEKTWIIFHFNMYLVFSFTIVIKEGDSHALVYDIHSEILDDFHVRKNTTLDENFPLAN